MAESLKIGLRICDPGKQGVPSHPLPYRATPREVGRVADGAAFSDDGTLMARDLELSFTLESLSRTFSAKYGSANPMNALASQLEFTQTEIPVVSMQGLLFSAHDFMHHGADLPKAARMLSRMLDWLEFCTFPWSGLARGPLLQLVVGPRSEYVYLERFEQKIEAFMPMQDPQVALLPYEVTGSLSFKREPLGLRVLSKMDLPTSRNLQGGTGGIISTKGL